MPKIKNILLLAGGDSTRFWPLREKNLSDFGGKPLIENQITALVAYSEKVIVVVDRSIHEEVKKIVDRFPTGSSCKIKVSVQKDDEDGQAGAIMSVRDVVDGETLILNASDIFNYSFVEKIINRAHENKNDYLFLAREVSDYFPGGYVKFAGDRVVGFVEKPALDKTPSNTIKLVADYFGDFSTLTDLLKNIDDKTDDRYERGLNDLINKGVKVGYLIYDNYWYALKYPWHTLTMMGYFLNRLKGAKGNNVTVSDKAIISGEVFIGDNVRIGDYAKIVGPVFIGDDTVVGDFAMVRESHIGKNCLIGGYSEITRSYLADKVMLHRNYVGDSVLSDEVMMGAGAVTANFRFDKKSVKSVIGGKKIDSNLNKFGTIIGKGAKIGVNSTLLPGIKIGEGAWVTPGSIVIHDIEDKTYLVKGESRRLKTL